MARLVGADAGIVGEDSAVAALVVSDQGAVARERVGDTLLVVGIRICGVVVLRRIRLGLVEDDLAVLLHVDVGDRNVVDHLHVEVGVVEIDGVTVIVGELQELRQIEREIVFADCRLSWSS